MSDLLTEPLPPAPPQPPLRPLARFTQLEADTFCEQCGYNLHGQPVSRDERLGIFLVRCPECGKHHPAGHQTTASSLWLGRLASAFLVAWTLIVLSVAITAAIIFGLLNYLPIEIYTRTATVDIAGREIEYRQLSPSGNYGPVYIDTNQTAPSPVYRAKLREITPELAPGMWQAMAVLHLLSIGAGLGLGILLVVFLWHWKRRRYFWVLLLPYLAGAYVIVFLLLADFYNWIRPWATQRVLYFATLQAAGIVLGILIGRPIARLLLRMFIPPRPRQHFNFLWRIDHKNPPSPIHATLAAAGGTSTTP